MRALGGFNNRCVFMNRNIILSHHKLKGEISFRSKNEPSREDLIHVHTDKKSLASFGSYIKLQLSLRYVNFYNKVSLI